MSQAEMRRRYDAVRARMQEAGLELLLVAGVRFVAATGYLRYLTNWAEPFAGEYLLFPLEGEPTFFARTSARQALVEEHLGVPATVGSNVPAVAAELRKRGVKRVGLCSLTTMTAAFYKGLRDALPDYEFAEAAHVLDDVRMVKSDEELAWIVRSAKLGDTSFRAFETLVQATVHEHDVFTELEHLVKLAGAENTYFMMDTGPDPVPKFIDMATKRYRKGDIVLFNAEIQGPGGYWTQLMRTVSLGDPGEKLRKAYAVARESLEAAEALIRPGARTNDLYRAMREVIARAGYPEGLHSGHSQGLDIFERPLVDGRDDIALQPNMIIILHPHIPLPSGGGVWVGETFVVTDGGCRPLHQVPRELAVI